MANASNMKSFKFNLLNYYNFNCLTKYLLWIKKKYLGESHEEIGVSPLSLRFAPSGKKCQKEPPEIQNIKSPYEI